MQAKLKQREAKKAFIKLMRSYKIPSYLKDEEDYDKLYGDNAVREGEIDPNAPKDEPLPAYYKDEKDYLFYKDDVDFMRFHKRTTDNIFNALQELVDSTK